MPLYFCVYTSYLHLSLSSSVMILEMWVSAPPNLSPFCSAILMWLPPTLWIHRSLQSASFIHASIFLTHKMLLLLNYYLKFISYMILVSSTDSLLESRAKRLNTFLPLLWLAKENEFQIRMKERKQERKILNVAVWKSNSKSIYWWVKEQMGMKRNFKYLFHRPGIKFFLCRWYQS